MKLNKSLFYIGILICFFTLSISIFITFNIDKNVTSEYINNILLNIFSGAFILIVTSLFDYFIQRRKILDEIMKECYKISNMFRKLRYFKCDDFKVLEGYSYQYKNDENEEQKKKFIEILEKYIYIVEQDYNDFWKLYINLEFLFDYNKEKLKLYNHFFNYVDNKKNIIVENVQYFREYIKSKDGDFLVTKRKLENLQKEIFYYEEQKTGIKFKRKIEKNINVTVGCNEMTNTCYMTENDVCKNLDSLLIEIQNIAYFNKDTKRKVM